MFKRLKWFLKLLQAIHLALTNHTLVMSGSLSNSGIIDNFVALKSLTTIVLKKLIGNQ